MFNPEKPVQTRDGRKARIICTNFKSDKTIVAAVQDERGEEYCCGYFSNGHMWTVGRDGTDLINIEEGEG